MESQCDNLKITQARKIYEMLSLIQKPSLYLTSHFLFTQDFLNDYPHIKRPVSNLDAWQY
jgi:hypothetical protein